MLKVECFSGYKLNERPVAFSLMDRRFEVQDIVDRWYGEGTSYFKVKADDDNIYLLKYDEWEDCWEFVFYQNPKKLNSLPESTMGLNAISRPAHGVPNSRSFTPLH
ncbi:MAG: hypothetical protein NPINA01_00450 [Nitrospinaceae bacterium]|nr:MAG: hypothetical protein NPINA01_00450 [Nitrospinaceae bacterium]